MRKTWKGKKLEMSQIFTPEGEVIPVTLLLLDSVEGLEEGLKVEVTGFSKGRGFAGVVKRHGFKGGPATHGQSDRERAPGSIGSTTTPGRVYKGKKMAGRMGNRKVTVKGLKIVSLDEEKKLISVSGAVPGPKKGKIIIGSANDGER